jgi:putative ABC transport system permease protein
MFKNYLRTAFRNLQQNKIYSFINIAGLSIGLACAMLIMLYIQDELSFDRFHKNLNQIYRIDKQDANQDGSAHYGSYTGYLQGPRFSSNIPEIQSFVRFKPGQVDIKTGADVQSQGVSFVDPNFFSVFSFPLVSGDAKSALSQPNSAVLSEEMAKKYFGHENAVGRTILVNENGQFVPHVVTGVAKDYPQNSSIKFQVVLPLKVLPEDENNSGNWFNYFLTTFVVIAPEANIAATQAKMDKVFKTDASATINEMKVKYGIKDLNISFALEPFAAIHLGKYVPDADEILSDRSNPVFSYILSAIAVFILLIACINFVNLTVARSVKRAKEIGIRKVIGGTRRQLMIQFLSESLILCLIAFSLAVVIATAVLPLFNQLSGKVLSLSYLLNAKLITGYAALFILTGLLAGFYPAAVLSNYNPVKTLYSRFSLSGKTHLQKSLVVFQFALASFLIIATLTIFLQFNYLTTQPLGYDDTNLVTLKKSNMTHREAALFKSALMKNPGIMDVAPKSGGENNNTVKAGSEKEVNVAIETIDASYLPLLQVPVVAGRNFSADFPSDSTQSVLVNEAFVKQADWAAAVGKQLTSFENNQTYSIAGVVKDYHYKPLTEKIQPQMFIMDPAHEYGMFYIKIKPGTATASLQFISAVFKNLFPESPLAYNFKDQQNAMSYRQEAKWKQILLFSAILTIFISCIGLFGLSVLAAEKRTKEIGVRKVLGASVRSIVTILSTEFLRLIVISLIISIPLAWIATDKWLQNYPYRVSPGWGLFALAAILVIMIALVTISFQSIKAAIANPVKSLRTEG